MSPPPMVGDSNGYLFNSAISH